MFELGWSEILVIAVVAIIVIGPKDLPRALRTVGQWTGKLKRMARDFQGQFNEAIREAELSDIKKSVSDIGKLDPMADLKKDLNKIDSGIRSELNKATAPSAATPAALAPAAVAAPAAAPAPAPPPVAPPVAAVAAVAAAGEGEARQ